MPRPSRGYTPYAKHNKHEEERGLNRVCRHLRLKYPDILFFTDFAAGLNLTDKERIAMMKQRSHDGIMDLTILAARQGYHGMVVEFKKDGVTIYKKDGKTLRKQEYRRVYQTPKGPFVKSGDHLQDQARVLTIAKREGYYSIWGLGGDRTIELIDNYLGGEQAGLEF